MTKELVDEPTAYLVRWWDDGHPRCRVQMGEIVEPWLDALKPEFVPLYAPPILARQRNEGIEAAAKVADTPLKVSKYCDDCCIDTAEDIATAIRALKEPE